MAYPSHPFRTSTPLSLLRRAAPLFLVVGLLLSPPSTAWGAETVDIGILSYRPLEETAGIWEATAVWLGQQLPEYRFRAVPLYLEELTQAVKERRVSFVLTNPEHYVLLHADQGLTALATLMPMAEGHPTNQFGGVIFTLAGRHDIRHLADLKGKRISAVSPHSMGGYLAQHWTLHKAGVDPLTDFTLTFTGMPHDRVVERVLAGEADAGFVRTGILERLIRRELIAASTLQVLNPREDSGYPQRLSTDLYPEWPLSALPDVADGLKEAVTMALLNMPPETEAARQGGYFGFSLPADYAGVEALMVRLDLHPYRTEFGWRDVFDKYAYEIAGALSLIGVLALLAAYQLRSSNRALNGALAKTNELARQQTLLLGSLGEGVYGIDRSGRCTFINPAGLAILGFEVDEVIGRDQHQLFHHHRPDGSAYPHTECPVYLSLQDGVRREVPETFIRRDGEHFPVRMTSAPIFEGGEIVGAVVVFQDITEETRRLRRMELLDAALRATANGVVITDHNGTIEWVNPAVSRLTGYSPEEAVGENPRILKSGAHEEDYYEELWRTISSGSVWHGDIVNRRKDGTLYHEEMTITPVVDGQGAIHHFIAVKQDISERKRLEEELRQLAVTDPLTGVANRRHFLQRLDGELHRIRRYGGEAALLMIDLDHFKQINDTWGHAAGDQVLRGFTIQARDHLRASDLLGRLGGEEFAVLLTETEPSQAVAFAERLRGQFSPVATHGEEIPFTVSIGVTAIAPGDDTPETPLARADEALYRAKAQGRNQVAQRLADEADRE